jgi:hypothetical protein
MYSLPLGFRLWIGAAERERGSRRGRSCRPVSTVTAGLKAKGGYATHVTYIPHIPA